MKLSDKFHRLTNDLDNRIHLISIYSISLFIIYNFFRHFFLKTDGSGSVLR